MTSTEAHRILSNGLANASSEHEWCMAFKMAIEALEHNNNQIISAEGRLFKVEKPVVKSVDCYNLWNIYGFKEITDGTE